jgi:hypothetical protein
MSDERVRELTEYLDTVREQLAETSRRLGRSIRTELEAVRARGMAEARVAELERERDEARQLGRDTKTGMKLYQMIEGLRTRAEAAESAMDNLARKLTAAESALAEARQEIVALQSVASTEQVRSALAASQERERRLRAKVLRHLSFLDSDSIEDQRNDARLRAEADAAAEELRAALAAVAGEKWEDGVVDPLCREWITNEFGELTGHRCGLIRGHNGSHEPRPWAPPADVAERVLREMELMEDTGKCSHGVPADGVCAVCMADPPKPGGVA